MRSFIMTNSRKARWFRHVARMGYMINTQKISVLESKRDYLLNLGVDARIISKQILK
jgi:hypothetical protein